MLKRGIILFLLLIPLAQAVGVTPPSQILNFKPNLQTQYQFSFFPTNANDLIKVSLSGDLSQYAKIDKEFLEGGGSVTVTISLPAKLDPGFHYINIYGAEQPKNQAGISAGTGIQAFIKVFAPYEGKYIEASLEVPNININDLGIIYIKIKNIGTLPISQLYSKVSINSNNQEIKSFETKKIPLNTEESTTLEAKFTTNDLKQGKYKAIATIYYDSLEETLDKEFLIGDLIVNIINYTDTLIENQINKFIISIESKFNNPINEIYADIFIFKNNIEILKSKTPTYSLNSWESKNLETFLDLTNINKGYYDINITLNYQDKLTTLNGKLDIIKKRFLPNINLIILLLIILSSIIWYLIIKKERVKNAKKS